MALSFTCGIVPRMTTTLRLNHVLIDVPAADRQRAVAFWTAALGREPIVTERYPDYSQFDEVTPGVGFTIQATGAEAARVHVDFDSDSREADVERLVALGATEVSQLGHWTVLNDPAGTTFCVVQHG
jgi:predicted enzyme related to lactoylglutathione lyase